MCTISVPGAQGSQKRLLDALELQPQVSVSHVDARNQTLGLCKNTKCSKPLSSLSLQPLNFIHFIEIVTLVLHWVVHRRTRN